MSRETCKHIGDGILEVTRSDGTSYKVDYCASLKFIEELLEAVREDEKRNPLPQ